ncbi:MAG: hypothetical protein HN348_15925, partial [Proteobacteria bacterium]|nr:hypothetical protein [Pseudomonadota bacterium]
TVVQNADWGDEQETIIKKSPFDDQADTYIAGQFKGSTEPKSDVRVTPPAPKATRIGWLGWMLTAVALGAGLVVGALFAGGALTGVMLGVRDTEAFLKVEAPPRTAVMLDGDAVSNENILVPGTTYVVSVTVDGYQTWQQKITLAPGEVRVLTVVTPKKEEKEQ